MAFLIPENLRTRGDVAPGVNRGAQVLHQALDDAATVWYEPLFDASDERPDLVVLVPEMGVLILEVLEEKAGAIRGARNGHVLLRRAGIEREVDDPLSRAETFASSLRSRLQGEGRLTDEQRLPVAVAGLFPYLARSEGSRSSLPSVVDFDRCLFREDIDASVADLADVRRRVHQLLGGASRPPLPSEAERLHRALIHPDTVIGSPQLPFAIASPEEELKVLDRGQEALAKGLGQGHRVIRGVAGSGKTLVLTYRARLLAEAFPHHRILVTCFNVALAGALGRQLDLPNVRVETLEALIGRARRTMDLEEMPYDTTSLSDRAESALRVLDEHPRAAGQFDHVLVDEGQDFPTPALRFAVRLLKPGSDSLLVVADAAQNIYRSNFRWKDAGINALGRSKVLDSSYRNTREILDYAHGFLTKEGKLAWDSAGGGDEAALIPPRLSSRSGPFPLLLACASPQDEVLKIIGQCERRLAGGVEPGRIAILYGRTTTYGFNWPDAIRKACAASDLPLVWATDPRDRSQRALLGADAAHMVLSTIHSAKGLEFAHVILCGYLDELPPEKSILSRRLIYVGMTRATHELVLTYSGEHRYIADLEA